MRPECSECGSMAERFGKGALHHDMLTHFISAYGYLAVFVLMTLESALIPIPSEVTMSFAGFLASRGAFSLWGVAVVGAVGNVLGSLIGYYIGYVLEEHVLLGWIRRYGRFLLVSEKDYERAESWFSTFGAPTVFFSRLLPGIRTFISLPAGVFRMKLSTFSLYTFAGSLLWSGILAWVGYYLGSQWSRIGPVFGRLQYGLAALVAFTIAYYVYRKMRQRRA